jgi:hypothetical protein
MFQELQQAEISSLVCIDDCQIVLYYTMQTAVIMSHLLENFTTPYMTYLMRSKTAVFGFGLC